MRNLLYLLLLILLGGCSKKSGTELIQNKRDNIINVKSMVKELKIDEILLNNLCDVYFMDSYLFICDPKSYDMQLHIFDRDHYKHIASTAPMGQGPNEISKIGPLEVDEENNRFWITDSGKNRIFCYNLDSVLNNPLYHPETEIVFSEAEIPANYFHIEDSLFMTTIIKPTGNYGYNQSVAKFNVKTGEIIPMVNLHPEIERMRVSIAVSKEYGVYVECYNHHDLICIRTLDGDLKYNIYGRCWDTETSNEKLYFNEALFLHDKICTLYSGDDRLIEKSNGELEYNWPTKIMLFNSEGDYLKTLDIGYKIVRYCWDKKRNRLILSFNDDIQFGYLDLDGII